MPNVVVEGDLPGAAKYDAFVESGTYILKRGRPEAWFVINHRLDNPHPDATYLGVLVVKALRREQQSPLWLYRNSGWIPTSDASYPLPFHTLQDFFARQGRDSTLDAFQAEFGIWHGAPTGDSRIDSWANRREWHRSPHACGAFERIRRQLDELRARHRPPHRLSSNAQGRLNLTGNHKNPIERRRSDTHRDVLARQPRLLARLHTHPHGLTYSPKPTTIAMAGQPPRPNSYPTKATLPVTRLHRYRSNKILSRRARSLKALSPPSKMSHTTFRISASSKPPLR